MLEMGPGQSEPGAKQFFDGSHRLIHPEQTIENMSPYFEWFGITRVANVTGLDCIGVPVVMVMRPNSRSVAVSQGKGVTLAAAKASGIMESIEGWHAEHIELPMLYGRFGDLASSRPLVDPAVLPQVAGSAYHRQLRLMWVEGRNLMDGTSCWVPYEMVHTDYTHPMPDGHGCFSCSSNGLASGNDLVEATVHAICEVIERDATGLWYHSDLPVKAARRLDLATVDDNDCAGLIAQIEAAGLSIAVWETTTDVGVPAFYALLTGDEHEHVGEGAGCHPAKSVALSRTLTEAVQTRMTYISGARDDMLPEEFGPQGMAQKLTAAHKLINAGDPQADYSGIVSLASQTLNQDQEELCARLATAGIDQVICVDLSKPEFGIAVVRVVIPGLEAPHDDEGYIPGARALAVSRSGQ